MRKKSEFRIDLRLSNIKIKNVTVDSNGDYHVHVSCCDVDGVKCNRCGQLIATSYGQCEETIIEHLPILDQKTYIHVKWPRFVCNYCNDKPTTSFHPEWLNETGKLTKAYEDYILKCLIHSTDKDVALKNRTTTDVIQGIVERRVSTKTDWNNVSPPAIGMYEIALKKGHDSFLTIVSDISNKGEAKILAVIDGRDKEVILPF
ncbi:MAG: transposase [Oligoflexia bacterium]|nr:transposase [Oligoflexia bacterium]